MKEYTYYDRITEYDEGRMSEEQRVQFEKDLQSNSELKKEYELFLEARSLEEVLQYEQLKKTIGGFQKQAAKVFPIAKVVPFWRRPLAIAAAVLVLVVAGFMLYSNLNYSDQRLFTAYYESPNFSDFRSVAATESDLAKAEKAFNEKDFKGSIAFAKSIEAAAGEFPAAQYLLAHALIEDQNLAEAVNTFETMALLNDPRFKEATEWYLALAYLKNDDEVSAKSQLVKITQQDVHGFKDDATELMQQLESGWRRVVF